MKTCCFLILCCVSLVLIQSCQTSGTSDIQYTSHMSVKYQVGHIESNGTPVIEEKFRKHPDVFGKYILSANPESFRKDFHCLIPDFQISSNKKTIWSVFKRKYFLDFSVVRVSEKHDTSNSTLSATLEEMNGKLYLILLYPFDNQINVNVNICDYRMIRPCMAVIE
jgi:hypothetical protein